MKDALDNTTRFGRIHEKNNAILNQLAPYSAQARLNPFDTCEFPNDVKIVGESCLIFDRIGKRDPSTGFGLMVGFDEYSTKGTLMKPIHFFAAVSLALP
jgi:hypothetical protein